MRKGIFIKIFIFLITFIVFLPSTLYSNHRFFLQNMLGDLIKVDIASGFVGKHPKIKGPRTDQIPLEFKIEEFENDILAKLDNQADKEYLKELYIIDNTSKTYKLKDEVSENITKIKKVHNIFVQNLIAPSYLKSVSIYSFENDIKNKISNVEEREFVMSVYVKDKFKYILNIDLKDPEKLRGIFMNLNKDNEMLTGLDEHGAPMPHNFARVFEAKSKSNFDVHFVWGIKFDFIRNTDKVEIGYITFGFSINLTNFVMPSLELMLKYNFIIYGYPFEPYVGAILYGGFIDGFPIGLSAIGGCDFFPMYYEDRIDNKNFYLTAELRIGAVLYSRIYFDSGLNNEGIWKRLDVLGEGGFFFGYGYIFKNY